MAKLKKSVTLETAFGSYVIDESLGEGGAGRVYGGIGPDGAPIAAKVLSADRATSDKKRRFKNEIGFLARNTHNNIVTVTDYGVAHEGSIDGAFYVMRKYDGSLRDLMRAGAIEPSTVLALFVQVLDGVEAAHLRRVVHRDLKPENILFDKGTKTLAIADFGIASFTEDLLVTLVDTEPTQRLANFIYAAPEQRVQGKQVGVPADIYALGLILNEMFTGNVPHGTEYATIGSVAKDFRFLDPLVDHMIRQDSNERPQSVGEVKGLIERHRSEAVSVQRLSKIDGTVISASDIDAPLAVEPPRVIGADWDAGRLILMLDRPVTREWIEGFQNIGSYNSVMGVGLHAFAFSGDRVTANVQAGDVQRVVDHFKEWLPKASATMKMQMEAKAQQEEAQRRNNLLRERKAEEERLRVLRELKI